MVCHVSCLPWSLDLGIVLVCLRKVLEMPYGTIWMPRLSHNSASKTRGVASSVNLDCFLAHPEPTKGVIQFREETSGNGKLECTLGLVAAPTCCQAGLVMHTN